MGSAIEAVEIALYVTAVILHIFGCILLWNVRLNPPFGSAQRLYLLNLCFSEIVFCSASAAYNIRKYIEGDYGDFMEIVYKINGSGVWSWYIGVMTMMTFDRFFTVYLNIRYLTIWSTRKTKITLLLVAVASMLLSAVFLPMSMDKFHNVSSVLWCVEDVVFLIILSITYSYFLKKIFHTNSSNTIKHHHSLTRSKSLVIETNNHKTIQHTYSSSSARTVVIDNIDIVGDKLTSRYPSKGSLDTSPRCPRPSKGTLDFRVHRGESNSAKSCLVTTSIILSFVLCCVVPDQVYFWGNHICKVSPDSKVWDYIHLFYPTGFILDAIIYIFLQRRVFKMLRKLFEFKMSRLEKYL